MKRLVVWVLVFLLLCPAVCFAARSNTEALQQILELLFENPAVAHQFLDSLENGTYTEGNQESELSPKFDEHRIKQDLLENGIWIAGWVGHPSGVSGVNNLEIIKSQTEKNYASYWVSISYKFDDSNEWHDDSTVKVRYEKFDQAWLFVRADFVD